MIKDLRYMKTTDVSGSIIWAFTSFDDFIGYAKDFYGARFSSVEPWIIDETEAKKAVYYNEDRIKKQLSDGVNAINLGAIREE